MAKVQKGQWIMELTPPPKLTWPLQVWKWGMSSGIWRIPSALEGASVRFTWSVQAYEDVQVVAGMFKAFRISLAIEVFGGGWGGGSSSHSPNLGSSSPGTHPRCASL